MDVSGSGAKRWISVKVARTASSRPRQNSVQTRGGTAPLMMCPKRFTPLARSRLSAAMGSNSATSSTSCRRPSCFLSTLPRALCMNSWELLHAVCAGGCRGMHQSHRPGGAGVSLDRHEAGEAPDAARPEVRRVPSCCRVPIRSAGRFFHTATGPQRSQPPPTNTGSAAQ